MVKKFNGVPNLLTEKTIGKAKLESIRKKSFGERNKLANELADKRDRSRRKGRVSL